MSKEIVRDGQIVIVDDDYDINPIFEGEVMMHVEPESGFQFNAKMVRARSESKRLEEICQKNKVAAIGGSGELFYGSCMPKPGQYNPTISEERKETMKWLTENRSLYGIPEVKKMSFFERVSYWLKTKWKFKIEFTVTKIPPVDMYSAHWPDEVVKEMMKMERVPIEYNGIGGK